MSQHDHHHEAPAPGTVDWRHNGVRVIKGNQLDPNTAQTPGMNRAAAINFARVGAEKLWAGTVTIHAGAKTGAHHHGELESVIYVLKGKARMRWGEAPISCAAAQKSSSRSASSFERTARPRPVQSIMPRMRVMPK